MSSVETPRSHIRNGKQGFRESRPHSIGPLTTAFVATALVAMGTLVVTGALLLIHCAYTTGH